VECQANLLEIVFALDASSRFAHLLYSWQQQGNQECDDRNDHQQFNQRETMTRRQRFGNDSGSVHDATSSTSDNSGKISVTITGTFRLHAWLAESWLASQNGESTSDRVETESQCQVVCSSLAGCASQNPNFSSGTRR
jgi:hypothetical protein